MRAPTLALAWALTSSLVSVARPALGQPAEPAPAAPPELVPPKLVEFVPAALAEEERPDTAARVVLDLTIDENGRVTAVNVVESAGALDAKAVDAARQFRFEPARRAGAPISVTIRYEYVFEAKPAPAPPPEAPPEPAPEAPPPPPAATAPSPAAEQPIPEFETTASVEAPPTEPARHDIDQETIRRIPGTRGDALKSVETLPGVARPPDGGDPILRGAANYESKTYLNGTPVPFLYHFGGLASFMSPYLVERLEVYPSNFSVRYGRVAGGIIEVRAKDPESDRLRAVVDLNLIDSSAYLEVPISEDVGVAAAVRRSNLDFFFEQFVPEDAYSVVAAPVYYDYQALGRIDLGPNTRLRLLGYGGRDSLKLFVDDAGDDPALAGEIEGAIGTHRGGFELQSRANGVTANLSATLGYVEILTHFGQLRQDLAGPEVLARGELGIDLTDQLTLKLGADTSAYFYEGTYRGPVPGQLEGDPNDELPLGGQRMVSDEDDAIDAANTGAYLELAYRPIDELLITPGVRVDHYSAFSAFSVDPRLSARYELTAATTLKAGIGSFSQAPEFWQALDSVGNPDLEPYRALHTSAGVEQRVAEAVELGVEGFYKHLSNVVVATPTRDAPFYTNDGAGRIYGSELSLKARWPWEGFGYLAYTLSRSERRDFSGGYRLFEADQTHILSLTSSQGLGAGWEVGLRFRLISGNPMTPITGSVYDARTGLYTPTFGETNSDRNPAFHQLDVRVEKKFELGRALKLATYVDVQNVYNAKNQEGIRYSYDYKESEVVTGLPFFPSIGLRGEL